MAGRKVDLEVAFRGSAAARRRRQNPVTTDAGTVGITLHALPTSIHRVSVATGPRRPPGRDP